MANHWSPERALHGYWRRARDVQTPPPWSRSRLQAAADARRRGTHLGGPRGDALLVFLQQREKARGVPVQFPNPGVPLVVATRVVADVVRDCAMPPPSRGRKGQRRAEECAASEGGSEERVVFYFHFGGVESLIWILALPAMADGPKEAF